MINAWVRFFSPASTVAMLILYTQREFTLQLLPVLEGKLRRTIPALLAHPSILAHTIYQALAFDAALQDEGFGLPGTTAIDISSVTVDPDMRDGWKGISEVILGQKEWLEAWVEGERKCKWFPRAAFLRLTV